MRAGTRNVWRDTSAPEVTGNAVAVRAPARLLGKDPKRPPDRDSLGVVSLGPLCPCHGERGLIRKAPHEYQCPRSKKRFRFSLTQRGYAGVEIRT